jgi:uncharacterized Zn-finger protein
MPIFKRTTVMPTRRIVTFMRPFSLGGFHGWQPAGQYSVEVDESLMKGMPYASYREMATMRVVTERGDRAPGQVAVIDPKELQRALAADAVPNFPPGFGEVIERRHSHTDQMTTEPRRLHLSVEHDAGITDVRIGVTEFNCVGGVPLREHAHVFLAMGDDGTARCPVCKTTFHFDSSIPPLRAGSKSRITMG